MKRVLTLCLALLVAGIAAGLLTAAPTQRKFSPRQEPHGHRQLDRPRRSGRARLRSRRKGRDRLGLCPQRQAAQVRAARSRSRPSAVVELSRTSTSASDPRAASSLLRGPAGAAHRSHRKSPREGVSSALILEHPKVVHLGTHRFDQTRAPDEVVARASADQVGWQLPPPGQGPNSARSRSWSGRTTRSGCTTASTTACWSGTPATRTRSCAPFRFRTAAPSTMSHWGLKGRSMSRTERATASGTALS